MADNNILESASKANQSLNDIKLIASQVAKGDNNNNNVVHTGKIVNSKTTKRELTGFQKLKNNFFENDAKDIKSVLVEDIIVPSIKRIASDALHKTIDMILGGGGQRPYNNRVNYNNRTNYGFSSLDSRAPYTTPGYNATPYQRKNVYDFNNISYKSYADAENVLNAMNSYLEEYGEVTVATLYELSNITTEYTDLNYGWTDLRSARIMHDYNGYYISLPKPFSIDRDRR